MSLHERFSQQKQHFGFLLNIRGIGLYKNSATADSNTRNFVKCEQLQSVLTNVETIEEVDVRRPGQDEEELRDELIVEQSSEIAAQSVI